jgi:hypothetical protein
MSEIQSGANLMSLGRMCERLRRPPAAIETVLEQMEPVLILNGLKYFSIAQETQVDGILRDLEIERIQKGHKQ